MKCNKLQSRLSAFFDGELNEPERKLIEQHVESCKGCRAVLAQFEKVHSFLDDGIQLHADPYLVTRVNAQVKETGSTFRRFTLAMQKTLVPASVLAGLLVGIFIGVQLNSLSAPQEAVAAAEQPRSTYSILDPNIYEPMPSGSITATYVNVNSTQ